MTKTAEAVIETALDVLKATGWCQGDLGDTRIKAVGEDGLHCSIGALAAGASIIGARVPRNAYQVGGRGVYSDAIRAVYYALPEKFRSSQEMDEWSGIRETLRPDEMVDLIVEWNDRLARNPRESTNHRVAGPVSGKRAVYRVFRKALATLRGET